MKVGIIGVGFVGTAVKHAFEIAGHTTVCIDSAKGYTSTYDDLADCSAVFVCVPSPPLQDGSCDTSYLREVVTNLKNFNKVVISKTTAPADTYLELQQQLPNLVFAPEFLREASAIDDYLKQDFAIIGGSNKFCCDAEDIIKLVQRNVTQTIHVSITEACIVKYLENCFLATKVTFMNEIYHLCQKINVNYDIVKTAIQYDIRQGNSHFDVPGPDGKFGWGGSCFPKDTTAMLEYAAKHGVELSVLRQAVDKNKIIRNH